MKVGLIDIEPKIVNAALMQISAYHKGHGDMVEWATPLTYDSYDVLYCSSIFDFTDKSQIPERAICGGTGYDVTSRLSRAMEDCDYDYSIYPDCDYSIVWFSRGCNRNCSFCCVQKKEGGIHSVRPKQINAKSKYIVVQDNNFFANSEWKLGAKWLCRQELPVDLQGVDVRDMDFEARDFLANMRLYRQLKIAWDNPREDMRIPIEWLIDRIPPYKIMCYVLIGFWSTEEEDLYRVQTLGDMGIDPFVMPYNKHDPYQRRFARWVNHKAIFKTVKWEDYKAGIYEKNELHALHGEGN